jgi:Predicted transcriptional regulator
MRFEVEVVCEELLPAVRRMMAQTLYDDYGLSQIEIADKMDSTQPSVSNYLGGSRGKKDIIESISSDPQIGVLIDDAASKAAKDEDYSQEISKIIESVRDKGLAQERFSKSDRIL